MTTELESWLVEESRKNYLVLLEVMQELEEIEPQMVRRVYTADELLAKHPSMPPDDAVLLAHAYELDNRHYLASMTCSHFQLLTQRRWLQQHGVEVPPHACQWLQEHGFEVPA